MWNDLSKPWQQAIELGWEAFKGKTYPIGAVIADSAGNIVSEGRNHVHDQESDHPLAGTYMAHAELSAMSVLKANEHPEIRSYTLYSTMEPCPMCFGTMVMMNIRNLRYGARDTYAGATDIHKTHYYVKQKPIVINHEGGDLEIYQLALQTAYEYQIGNCYTQVIEAWRKANEKAVYLGEQVFKEGYFTKAIHQNYPVERVYNDMIERSME